MANNLFISYDLYAPGQNYEKVIAAIKSLGTWAKVQKSFWYVKSTSSSSQAADAVWLVMDSSDSLIVVDATNNTAHWHNLNNEVTKHIQGQWQ
jgi:hypothetical protein